jgi:hypothetical protein
MESRPFLLIRKRKLSAPARCCGSNKSSPFAGFLSPFFTRKWSKGFFMPFLRRLTGNFTAGVLYYLKVLKMLIKRDAGYCDEK